MGPTTPLTGANLPLPGSSTTLPYTTTQKYRIDSCTALAEEIRPYLVGPMPAQQFLDDFFPLGDLPGLDSVPVFTPGCYRGTVEAKKEKLAYKPFVSPPNEFFCFLTTAACFQDQDNGDIHPRPPSCQFISICRLQSPVRVSIQDQTRYLCLLCRLNPAPFHYDGLQPRRDLY